MSIFDQISRLKKASATEDSFMSGVAKKYHKDFDANMLTKKSDSIDKVAFDRLTSKVKAVASEEDVNCPIVTTLDAYTPFKELADSSDNDGIKSIAFHMKNKWKNDPEGYLTLSDIDSAKKYAESRMPKRMFAKSSQLVSDTFNSILKASIKNRFDLSSLDKIAGLIEGQEDFVSAVEFHGFTLDRADHEEVRKYIAYRAGIEVVDQFSSADKVKQTLDSLSGNAAEFDLNKLKGILTEEWGASQAAIEKREAIEALFGKEEGEAIGKLTLVDALNQSDIAHNNNPKDGKTYIARKDLFGEYVLYVERKGTDAKLLNKFSSIEELVEDTEDLPHSWVI